MLRVYLAELHVSNRWVVCLSLRNGWKVLQIPVLDCSISWRISKSQVLWIELECGHPLAWEVKALKHSVVSQVPNLHWPVRRTRCDPFGIRALTDAGHCFTVFSERSDTLFLPLIPHSDFGVRSTSEQIGVAHRSAKGGTSCLVTSEGTNFSRFLDVPRVRHTWHCTCEELLNTVAEDHCRSRWLAHHTFPWIGLSQLPNYDIVLIVSRCQHIAPIWTYLGTSEVGPWAYKIVVFFY